VDEKRKLEVVMRKKEGKERKVELYEEWKVLGQDVLGSLCVIVECDCCVDCYL